MVTCVFDRLERYTTGSRRSSTRNRARTRKNDLFLPWLPKKASVSMGHARFVPQYYPGPAILRRIKHPLHHSATALSRVSKTSGRPRQSTPQHLRQTPSKAFSLSPPPPEGVRGGVTLHHHSHCPICWRFVRDKSPPQTHWTSSPWRREWIFLVQQRTVYTGMLSKIAEDVFMDVGSVTYRLRWHDSPLSGRASFLKSPLPAGEGTGEGAPQSS